MGSLSGNCEIVEAEEELNTNEKGRKHYMARQGRVYSIEDDINQLFDSANIKMKKSLQKNPMKQPVRPNSPQPFGIEISESVSLKQALRGLCISQASEMAALKKRAMKSRMSEVAAVEAKLSGVLPNKTQKNHLEISFPGEVVAQLSETIPSSSSKESHLNLTPSKEKIVPLGSGYTSETCVEEVVLKNNLTVKHVLEMDESGVSKEENKDHVDNGDEDGKIMRSTPCIRNPIFRNKNFVKRKTKPKKESDSKPSVSPIKVDEKTDGKSTTKCNEGNVQSKVGSNVIDGCSSDTTGKAVGISRPKEKGEFSQSSKSSIGEYSTSTSEESSGSSRCCNRPHMSKDTKWESIHRVQNQQGILTLKNFNLLKRLGSGDIGTVYLAELVGTRCFFALKVMDNEFLARRKKLMRAQTERETLQMLDHPFLPTLYAHFVTDKMSCLVMEYCPGGDLHVIRQKQPSRCFSEQAARFYVAEVLLALEYLHMLGIIYRDLKPENILVREDGHIMLSDFDLSLKCIVNPTLLRHFDSSPTANPTQRLSSTSCSQSSCINPFCLQPKPQKLKFDQSSSSSLTQLPQLVAEPTEARSNSFVGTHEYLAPEIVNGDGHGSAVDWWTYGIFLFELLYGRTPFKGSNNDVTLCNVVSQPLKFPDTPLVSFHAKDLIRGLLMKQPESRLGFVRGAAEIKQHPFFDGLNWALIRCAVPPERPKLYDVGDREVSSVKENGKSMVIGSSENIEFELF